MFNFNVLFNFILNVIYPRFKVWFWLLLTLLFTFSTVMKVLHGALYEVILNVVLTLVCFLIFVRVRWPKKAADSQGTETKIGRLAVLFTALSLLAAAAMLPYQQQLGLLQPLADRLSIPLESAAVLSVVQTTIMCLVTSYIGLLLCTRVNLGAPLLGNWVYRGVVPKFSGKWMFIGILGSLLGTFIMGLLEVNVFQLRLPALHSDLHVDLWKAALVLFYGGIVEEVLLRLFLMTLIVWILTIPLRRKQKKEIPSYFYWTAIVLTAVIFGLAHLPASIDVYGDLSALLFVRAIVSNGLLGIFFGYLYWKKGLEYAIIAHMAADLFFHVVWPAILG